MRCGERLRMTTSLALRIPQDKNSLNLRVEGKVVSLTNLQKIFWPELQLTKGHLLQYYATVSPYLLPHVADRAMVMKRFPHGIAGDHFFMKRVPEPHPEWLSLCRVEHASGNVIDFPVVTDLASLLWVVNLGCIDLNPWYARCEDINRPDFLHFDLDPVESDPPVPFFRVLEAALLVRDKLQSLKMKPLAKTTGSRGIHIYVAIERLPLQKQVWTVAKRLAFELAEEHPGVLTAEYKIAKRPQGHVLVDYNQNAWGKTLASVYSVRPRPLATVSAPVTWDEIEDGFSIDNFHLLNMPERLETLGDLWKPLLAQSGRYDLTALL